VVRSGELQPSPGGTITFEGDPYGSGVSFFLVYNEPGAGPELHRHPSSETWIVRSGRARFTADGDELEAGPGDIIVVTPETPHKSRTSAPTGWTSSAFTIPRKWSRRTSSKGLDLPICLARGLT
jgi:uncharacterized RmlC-like cupin family protein